jgi:hypothetical protein
VRSPACRSRQTVSLSGSPARAPSGGSAPAPGMQAPAAGASHPDEPTATSVGLRSHGRLRRARAGASDQRQRAHPTTMPCEPSGRGVRAASPDACRPRRRAVELVHSVVDDHRSGLTGRGASPRAAAARGRSSRERPGHRDRACPNVHRADDERSVGGWACVRSNRSAPPPGDGCDKRSACVVWVWSSASRWRSRSVR